MGNSFLWKSFKREFKRENLSLNFENNSQFLEKDPEQVLESFHATIWPCCNPFVYLVYRVGIAIYYTIWFFESIIRNAEYRAQNFKMSNKQKTNSLHLHPWPLYMTSWSLTILLIHLWLSAFIVLYFYSVNQKTRLTSLFTCLFGPISCANIKTHTRAKSTSKHKFSGKNRQQSKNRAATTAKTNPLLEFSKSETPGEINKENEPAVNTQQQQQRIFFTRFYRIIFSETKRVDTIEVDAERAQVGLFKTQGKENISKECTCDSPKLPAKFIRCNNSPKRGSPKHEIKEADEIDQEEACEMTTYEKSKKANLTADEDIENKKSNSGQKETYCVKKSACEYPSSLASDAKLRSDWIKKHVPCVILTLIKISWLLYNQIVISAIVVTVGYFSYVFITELETEPTWFSEIGNWHRHGFNSIVALIDIFLLAYPVCIMHFVYTVAYGWVYALVTFIFWLQDPVNNIIYTEIDYKRPYFVLTGYFGLTALTFVLQIVHFFAYRLKLSFRYGCTAFK